MILAESETGTGEVVYLATALVGWTMANRLDVFRSCNLLLHFFQCNKLSSWFTTAGIELD